MAQFLPADTCSLQQANARWAGSEQQPVPRNLHSQGFGTFWCPLRALRRVRGMDGTRHPCKRHLPLPPPSALHRPHNRGRLHPLLVSASEPPQQGDLTPDQKNYHQKISQEAMEFVNNRRNLPTERQADIRATHSYSAAGGRTRGWGGPRRVT